MIGYRNNRFFSYKKSLCFEGYPELPMVIFRTWAISLICKNAKIQIGCFHQKYIKYEATFQTF